MVCPLRFILVGVSATVALLVAFNTSWSDGEETAEERKDKITPAGESKGDWSLQILLRTVLEMATGRYLYNLYQQQRLAATPPPASAGVGLKQA